MSEYDRWRDEGDRHRGRDTFGRDRQCQEGARRYETDYDRDRSRSFGGYGQEGAGGFGRGSRDEPYASGYRQDPYATGQRGSGDYGSDWARSDWARDEQRPSYGYGNRNRERDLGYGGFGRDAQGRTSSEMAFGRDASGRDWRSDSDRRSGPEDRGFFERAGDEIASWFGDDDAERRRRQDSRDDDRYGQHRGRGPKNYQRSDERIRDDVNDRLTDDYRLDASEIDVAVSGREVTLTGTVRNRADKRRAEDLAEAVSGVSHVQNNLRVQNQTEASWSGSSAAASGSSIFGTSGTSAGTGTGAARSTTPRTDPAKV